MNDQNIDKQELGKDLKAILINKLGGDHNFTKWLKEVKEEFLMHL